MPATPWTYSDYVTLDGAARLTRLRLHIQEVSDAISSELGADGFNKSQNNITQYLIDLRKEEASLGSVHGSATNGGVSRARLLSSRQVS